MSYFISVSNLCFFGRYLEYMNNDLSLQILHRKKYQHKKLNKINSSASLQNKSDHHSELIKGNLKGTEGG